MPDDSELDLEGEAPPPPAPSTAYYDRRLWPSRCGTVEFDPIVHPVEWGVDPPVQIQDAGTLQFVSRTHIKAQGVPRCAQHEAAGIMVVPWGDGGMIPVLCSLAGSQSRVSFGAFYVDPDTGGLTAYMGFDAPPSYLVIFNSGIGGIQS